MLANRIEFRIAVFALVLSLFLIGPVRAQTDGEIDAAFTTNIGSGVNGAVNVPILQPDGKILIGGGFTNVAGYASTNIARLNSDGTFDAGFVTGSGFNGPVSDLVLQADGSVIVVGQFTAYNGATVASNIARLDSAGLLDTRFNATVGSGFNGAAESVTLQLNGNIIIGGQFTEFNGVPAQYIARIDTNGVFDTSFNSIMGASLNNTLTTVLADLNGNILLGGSFTSFNGGNYVARLNADGSPDANFSSAIPAAGSGRVTALALQPDGKILAGGVFTVSVNSVTSTDIARLNTNGSLDSAFSTAVGSGFTNFVGSFGLQPDGKILAGGVFTSFSGVGMNRIARLNSSGSLDTTFSIGSGFNSFVNRLVLRPEGSIVVAGGFGTYNGTASNSVAELYSAPLPPVIAAIEPSTGTALGGTPTVLTGINMATVTGVTFGGVAATSFSVNAEGTQLNATTPAHTAEAVDVVVTTTTRTATKSYTYTLAPQSNLSVTATPSSILTTASSTLSTSGGTGSGNVSYAITGGTGSCSISGAMLTAITAGSCEVTATKAATSTYAAVASAPITVQVGLSPQNPLVVNATPGDISTTATSSLSTSGGSGTGNVSYAITGGTGTCSISGTTLTPTSAGTCEVTASKAADTLYAAATSTPVVVFVRANAQCGTANGVYYPSQPDTGSLCRVGIPSAVSQSSAVFSWNCQGLEGGTTVSCGTTKATQPALTITASPKAVQPGRGTILSIRGGAGKGRLRYRVVTSGGASCSITTVNGKTFLKSGAQGVGVCNVTATKSGDARYNSATSAPLKIVVGASAVSL
jgi:uncharacterized delta-60 repeat protein